MENKERIIIFIDGSNHYHIIKEMFNLKKSMDFNFEKFIKEITNKRELIKVYYYTATLDRKKDDINLAVDMVRLAFNDKYDTAVLVSSDGDFVPAIKAVREIGKKIENIGFETKFSYHLKQECNMFRKFKKEEVKKFISKDNKS